MCDVFTDSASLSFHTTVITTTAEVRDGTRNTSLKEAFSLPAMTVHAVAQSCLTLCDPMDCSPPGSSVHGIFLARILDWVPMPSSRGFSQPRD